MKQKTEKEGKIELTVEARNVFGKKLKTLRETGDIPANIYGPGFKSQAVTVTYKNFTQAYKKAKETGVVYLTVGKDVVPVLIKSLQKHPVENRILHIDFRKIDLSQKIETEVPIKITGESIAVTQKGGILLTQSDHLLVEALPADIPQQIDIDVSVLDEVGKDIKVSDLPKNSSYLVKEEPEKVVVSVVAHKEESLTPETTTEAPEVISEAKEGEEGATPAQGEEKQAAPKEEEKGESKDNEKK